MQRLAVLLVALTAMIRPAWGEDLPLAAFVGTWTGSAVSKQFTPGGLAYTTRDLDVTIAGDADAFELSWTTLLRPDGLADDTHARRRTTQLRFVRTGGGRFDAEDMEDEVRGWARVDERSLIVYFLHIDDEGVYELSHYVRTLADTGVMDLQFTRVRDGKTEVSVTGVLSN